MLIFVLRTVVYAVKEYDCDEADGYLLCLVYKESKVYLVYQICCLFALMFINDLQCLITVDSYRNWINNNSNNNDNNKTPTGPGGLQIPAAGATIAPSGQQFLMVTTAPNTPLILLGSSQISFQR